MQIDEIRRVVEPSWYKKLIKGICLPKVKLNNLCTRVLSIYLRAYIIFFLVRLLHSFVQGLKN
jgi:hypothetical protein